MSQQQQYRSADPSSRSSSASSTRVNQKNSYLFTIWAGLTCIATSAYVGRYWYQPRVKPKEEMRRFWHTSASQMLSAAYAVPSADDADKWLIPRARGRVLELAGGTGPTLSLYDPSKVEQLEFTDTEPTMLEIAQRRNKSEKLKISYRTVDAESLPYPDKSFDTVVDRFGLCTYHEPGRALSEMNRVCKSEGDILLYEWGQPSNPFYYAILSVFSPLIGNAITGYFLNRDLYSMIYKAGFEIKACETMHGGISQIYILGPSHSPSLASLPKELIALRTPTHLQQKQASPAK